MNVLAFDIETIPDVDAGRKLLGVDDLPDSEVAHAMFRQRREKTGNDFLPTHLQRVVAISVAYRNTHQDRFSIWTIGDIDSSEKDMVQNFFDGVDKHTPTLVTWNGSGFDLPVLHYRGLVNGVTASRYWELGEDDNSFKWNNYIGRFHLRHTDLMDVLAGYSPRAFAPLEDLAVMLGLPGKMGMSGSKVWDYYQEGKLQEIRDYCETDALNTYLVYLQWQFMRGQLDQAGLDREQAVVVGTLEGGAPHFQEFLQQWERPNNASE